MRSRQHAQAAAYVAMMLALKGRQAHMRLAVCVADAAQVRCCTILAVSSSKDQRKWLAALLRAVLAGLLAQLSMHACGLHWLSTGSCRCSEQRQHAGGKAGRVQVLLLGPGCALFLSAAFQCCRILRTRAHMQVAKLGVCSHLPKQLLQALLPGPVTVLLQRRQDAPLAAELTSQSPLIGVLAALLVQITSIWTAAFSHTAAGT